MPPLPSHAAHLARLEAGLWEAADQLRANSRLNATEYSMPVLGLIFLRHATNRFDAVRREVEAALPVRGGVRRALGKDDFARRAAIYLPDEARYDHLAALPESENLGAAINAAMTLVEEQASDQLQGQLPKDYGQFEPDLLRRLVALFNGDALRTATGDVFGRIYEYFLNEFAQSGAQEEGAFFTPPSLVRLIVNVIEPDRGTVFDPACGSAGMLVWSAHFLEAHERDPGRLKFAGREKSDTTVRLARMNVAVHGFDADIQQGNTFYQRYDEYLGACDFVMANPPFNVDGVDHGKVKDDPRLWTAKKLPGVTKEAKGKRGKPAGVSNANYLWVQYFRAYLTPTGRAGFVMAASATDAGHGEQEIRRELIETGDVDAIVRIGEKFFYTRSLPCTLWFLDRGKPVARRDRVLMLDARGIHRVVNRRVHDFSDEQLANLTAVAWLWRGQGERFRGLVRAHLARADASAAALPDVVAAFEAARTACEEAFAVAGAVAVRVVDPGDDPDAWREARTRWDEAVADRDGALAAFTAERDVVAEAVAGWRAAHAAALDGAAATPAAPALHAAHDALAAALPSVRALGRLAGEVEKRTAAAIEHAERGMGVRREPDWDARAVRQAREALAAAGAEVAEACRLVAYNAGHAHWLLARFPEAEFVAVPGLCAAPTLSEIAAAEWSLTPGRYVGAAAAAADEEDDEAIGERLREIHEELAALNDEAAELARRIGENAEALAL